MSAAIGVLSPESVAGSTVDSTRDKFYLATVTFQRARQLKQGARPRVDARGHTFVRTALLEVMAGLVDGDGKAP